MSAEDRVQQALRFASTNGFSGALEVESELADLKLALARHGGHSEGCKTAFDGRPCTCGWQDIVSRYDLNGFSTGASAPQPLEP